MNIKISERYLIIILTLFTLGTVTTLSGIGTLKSDIYLAFIIASLIASLLYLILTKLFTKFIKENIFSFFESFLGKITTKIIITFYVLFASYASMISISYYVSLIKDNDLNDTPKYFISLFAIYLYYKALKYKEVVFSKWCVLFFPLIIIAIFVPTLLSVNLFKYSNLFPLFISKKETFIISIFYLLSTIFGEVIFASSFILKNCDKNINIKKVLLLSLLISFLAILSIYLRNVLILGGNNLYILDYPAYLSTSLIKIGDYFQRFEIFITTSMFFNNFVRVFIMIYFINDGLLYLFNRNVKIGKDEDEDEDDDNDNDNNDNNIKNKNYYKVIILFIFTGSLLFFNVSSFNYFSNYAYFISSIIFTLIIPSMLYLVYKIVKFI